MDKKRVLVVDDEPDILKVLDKRLTDAGYSVITADNGVDAIEIAKKERPDLILLDIMMPGMDGSTVSVELKSHSKTKDIPIMFLTCLFTQKEEKEIGHVLANNVFIAKPYKIEELLEEIERNIF